MRKYFVILATIGFLLYFPSLFGPFLWDDEDFVYANKYVANFQIDKFLTQSQTAGRDKLSNYYRPIPQIVYATTHAIFGFNPFWYHLVNILVHITASCAIFYFFFRLTTHYYPSFLISLVFLVHPVQTEAVSYVSGLSDPLFVLFGFLSLISFLEKKTTRSVFFLILSLLSKETGIVFLPLTFLLNYRNGLPYILTTGVYLLYHFTFINQLDVISAWGNSFYAHSLVTRLLTFIQNLYSYFWLLIYPKDLFMERDYSVPIQTSFFHWSFILSLTLFPLIFYLVRKNKLLVFCFLAFFISFIPYTGLVLINGIFYEHFLYLPLVFFFAFLIILFQSLKPTFARPPLIKAVIIIWTSLLIVRNILRQLDWADSVKFYSQTLEHAPQSIRIQNGLAMAYADKGDLESAIRQYQLSIRANPNVPNLYHNLANAYLANGDIQKAEENYLKAITVDPKFFFSYQSLANLYQQTGQTDKLAKLFERFKSIDK